MAESFSREKLRQAPQKEGGWKILLPSSGVTPAGTSIEVQNEWEENTHTHFVVVAILKTNFRCQYYRTCVTTSV